MKKLLSVLLAAVMMLSTFTACGGGSGEGEAEGGEKVLFIGGSGPLTGDYATYGTSVKNGATLAMEEIRLYIWCEVTMDVNNTPRIYTMIMLAMCNILAVV